MAPAAAIGLDVAKFLNNTQKMVQACGASVAVEQILGRCWGLFSARRR